MTYWACPVFRYIFPGCSWLYTIVWISLCRIINISAWALILIHMSFFSFLFLFTDQRTDKCRNLGIIFFHWIPVGFDVFFDDIKAGIF